MRILLDENLLSKKLKQPLTHAGHSVQNVEDMGWRGQKDRDLLEMAAAHPFDVFITADKNLPYQQNLQGYAMRILVLNAVSTRPATLIPLIEKVSSQLDFIESGTVTFIDDSGSITPFNTDE